MRATLALWPLLIAVSLGGWDLFTDDNARPWYAYAWSKTGNRAQWWFTSFETYRDCVEATRHEVSTGPNGAWYSEPVANATNWTQDLRPQMKAPNLARFSAPIDLEGINELQATELLTERLKEFQSANAWLQTSSSRNGWRPSSYRSRKLAFGSCLFGQPNASVRAPGRKHRRLRKSQLTRCSTLRSTKCVPSLHCSNTAKTA